MSAGVAAAIRRVAWVALDTCRALMRQRLMVMLGVLALFMIVAGRGLLALDFGAAPQRFVIDFGFAAIALFGVAIAIVATTHVVLGDFESGTAAVLLAKPLGRTEYVLGKWTGVMMLLALFCALTGGLVAVMAEQAASRADGGVSVVAGSQASPDMWRGVAIASLLQWLKLGIVAAGVLVLTSYVRSAMLVIVVGFVLVLVGYLRGAAQALYSAASARPLERVLEGALAIIPDLQLFEAADRITLGPDGAVGATEFLLVGGYAGVYTLAFGALAAWILQHRDV